MKLLDENMLVTIGVFASFAFIICLYFVFYLAKGNYYLVTVWLSNDITFHLCILKYMCSIGEYISKQKGNLLVNYIKINIQQEWKI